jgi:hypothetical protein
VTWIYIGSSASLPVSWSTKPRADSLDLHPRLGLLLDVFHENTLRHPSSALCNVDWIVQSVTHGWPNDLRPDIEVSYRLETDWELLLGPFALR